ncbi:hypothetical protein SEA_TUNATARTARE_263 [Streptomyces phage TunaTartare]|uniref:Uncharacterized protein n=1 Tax=Streptomyces phage TunaTartare TaxID=2848887 RepID=A0A8F2E839_9CAUD|nr:hypothetical protein PP457_gp017 [Streptomyces phage TunaTartare]QWT30125.1 hypothetical protein SEA_TUNATARTARE_263 [Streptomyces phage TunaTartare]
MPYGLAQRDTVEYVTERAAAQNVSDRIELESEKSNYTLSVIIDGALYEEFDFWSDGYAVNVADWVAELTEREGITDYDVLLSEIDSPDTLYRKSGYSW